VGAWLVNDEGAALAWSDADGVQALPRWHNRFPETMSAVLFSIFRPGNLSQALDGRCPRRRRSGIAVDDDVKWIGAVCWASDVLAAVGSPRGGDHPCTIC